MRIQPQVTPRILSHCRSQSRTAGSWGMSRNKMDVAQNKELIIPLETLIRAAA